jgi:uncharacterized membrane protein YkgB
MGCCCGNKECNAVVQGIARWMNCYGSVLMRYAIALVFIWFGLLKCFMISPAEDLVAKTVPWLPKEIFVPVLGWWEFLIGFFFLFKKTTWAAIVLMFLQMPGTFLPLILLPELCFTGYPFGLTMEGQYIIKNFVLISGALVVGGTLYKGGEK